MIQRIQSIFLFLAALFSGSHFFTNFAKSDTAVPALMADKVYEIQDSPILLGLCILGIAAAVGAIFLFKNRGLQMKISTLALVVAILLPLTAFLLLFNERTPQTNVQNIHDQAGLYMSVLPIVLLALAIRYIKKDDKIVKSMDRLR